MAAPPLHPSLAPIAFLLGTWRGDGHGEYPTIDDFAYTEELTFGHGGKPFLTYAQRSWAPNGSPLHVETGYLRAIPAPDPAGGDGAALEMVLSQPTGVVELLVGRALDGVVELRSTTVALTPTAKSVTATERSYRLDGTSLRTDLEMAAVGEAMTHHLTSVLTRT